MSEHLDCHLVRVPFEALKRAAKERKAIVDQIRVIQEAATVASIAKLTQAAMPGAPIPKDAGDAMQTDDDATPSLLTTSTGAEGAVPPSHVGNATGVGGRAGGGGGDGGDALQVEGGALDPRAAAAAALGGILDDLRALKGRCGA